MTELEEANETFRRHVTGFAFNLSLSRNMIAALDHIANCRYDYGDRAEHDIYASIWHARTALKRRGLIVWGPRRPELSEAGRLIHQACKLAGFYD